MGRRRQSGSQSTGLAAGSAPSSRAGKGPGQKSTAASNGSGNQVKRTKQEDEEERRSSLNTLVTETLREAPLMGLLASSLTKAMPLPKFLESDEEDNSADLETDSFMSDRTDDMDWDDDDEHEEADRRRVEEERERIDRVHDDIELSSLTARSFNRSLLGAKMSSGIKPCVNFFSRNGAWFAFMLRLVCLTHDERQPWIGID